MAVTLRTLMDRILLPLGEDLVGAVPTLSKDYHLILLNFLNQIKEEVEDAHNWRALRQTVNVVVGTSGVATITEGNERTRLVRAIVGNSHVPLVFDITNAASPERLDEMPLAQIDYLTTTDGAQQSGGPTHFALENTSGDVLKLRVWPKPTANRTIQLTLIVPQEWLLGTDLDDTIKIPTRPILQGTLWYAFEERGEEQGQNGFFTEERYRQSLDDAIARDNAEQGDAYELTVV